MENWFVFLMQLHCNKRVNETDACSKPFLEILGNLDRHFQKVKQSEAYLKDPHKRENLAIFAHFHERASKEISSWALAIAMISNSQSSIDQADKRIKDGNTCFYHRIIEHHMKEKNLGEENEKDEFIEPRFRRSDGYDMPLRKELMNLGLGQISEQSSDSVSSNSEGKDVMGSLSASGSSSSDNVIDNSLAHSGYFGRLIKGFSTSLESQEPSVGMEQSPDFMHESSEDVMKIIG